MNKEEFLEKLLGLNNQIAALKNEYISSNMKYSIGSKLRITYPGEPSYLVDVIGNMVNDNYEVLPILRRTHKNGHITTDKTFEFGFSNVKIEEIEVCVK